MRLLRLLAYKAEAAFWTGRMFSRTILPPAAAGWLAADADPSGLALLGFLAFMWLSAGALFTITDLFDIEDDKVTAPFLPLAAGLLTPFEAKLVIGLELGAALGILAVLAGAADTLSVALIAVAVATASALAYPFVKSIGPSSSLFAALPFASVAVLGYGLAGGDDALVAALAVAYVAIDALYVNVLVAVIDVERDPLVGHDTLPVRIGARRAMWVAGAAAAALIAISLVLAALVTDGWLGLPVVLAAAVVSVLGYRRAIARVDGERGRVQRSQDQRLIRNGRYLSFVALLCVLSLPAGLIVGAAGELLFRLGDSRYWNRVVGGGLSRALLEVRP